MSPVETVQPKKKIVKAVDPEIVDAIRIMQEHAEWLDKVNRPTLAVKLRMVLSLIPGGKKLVPRNPLMDALAEACGFKVSEVPTPMWKIIATAIRDIKEVCPALDQAEIHLRAANYLTKWPDRDLTPLGLSKWWASCGASALQKPIAIRRGDNA